MKTFQSILANITYVALSAVAAFGLGFIVALVAYGVTGDQSLINPVGYTFAAVTFPVIVAVRGLDARQVAGGAFVAVMRVLFWVTVLN